MLKSSGPILVTGGRGQIGSAIAEFAALRDLEIYCPDRTELDLLNKLSIVETVSSHNWSAVINCAAYTAVDKAESEQELAWAVNAEGPKVLAEETARLGIPIIHVSTDYVFDGAKPTPYLESDPVNPQSVYGLSKAAGETAIRSRNANHAIVRTAWVVSAGKANFLNTMLQLGAVKEKINVVSDQIGCPTSASDIADALLTVAMQLGDRGGTWHFVNSGVASWYEFATHIFERTKERNLPFPKVSPISTAEYPTPATRPLNSQLDISKIRDDFSINPRSWRDAVDILIATQLYI